MEGERINEGQKREIGKLNSLRNFIANVILFVEK